MIDVSFSFDKLALRAMIDRSRDLGEDGWFVTVWADKVLVARASWDAEHMRVDAWRAEHWEAGDSRRNGNRDEALRAHTEELLREAVIASNVARIRERLGVRAQTQTSVGGPLDRARDAFAGLRARWGK